VKLKTQATTGLKACPVWAACAALKAPLFHVASALVLNAGSR